MLLSYRQFSGQIRPVVFTGDSYARCINATIVKMAEWDFFAKCLLTMCCCLPIAVSFPNGAPPYETCYYMQPRHLHPHTHRRVHAQGDLAPFNITVDKTTFRPDRPLRGKRHEPFFFNYLSYIEHKIFLSTNMNISNFENRQKVIGVIITLADTYIFYVFKMFSQYFRCESQFLFPISHKQVYHNNLQCYSL